MSGDFLAATAKIKERTKIKETTTAKTKEITLTERDVEILRFINDFGFCEMPQIEKRFGFKGARGYQVMQRLMKGQCIKHERVFHNRHGVYLLTKKGARFTDLRALNKIPTGNYEHQIAITNLCIRLRELYPSAQWISERHLQQDKFCDGVGKIGHLADAILILEDGKKVAIEVELRLKGKERTEKILKGYGTDFNLHEVWYYCRSGLIGTLKTWAADLPFIKIYDLAQVLG